MKSFLAILLLSSPLFANLTDINENDFDKDMRKLYRTLMEQESSALREFNLEFIEIKSTFEPFWSDHSKLYGGGANGGNGDQLNDEGALIYDLKKNQKRIQSRFHTLQSLSDQQEYQEAEKSFKYLFPSFKGVEAKISLYGDSLNVRYIVPENKNRTIILTILVKSSGEMFIDFYTILIKSTHIKIVSRAEARNRIGRGPRRSAGTYRLQKTTTFDSDTRFEILLDGVVRQTESEDVNASSEEVLNRLKFAGPIRLYNDSSTMLDGLENDPVIFPQISDLKQERDKALEEYRELIFWLHYL
jgi:hypothetical protein